MIRKKIKLTMIIIISIIIILVGLFIIDVVILTPFNPFISEENVKGNVWLLTHIPNHANTIDVDKRLRGMREKAIPELEECIEKYSNKNDLEKVRRCKDVLEYILSSNSSKK